MWERAFQSKNSFVPVQDFRARPRQVSGKLKAATDAHPVAGSGFVRQLFGMTKTGGRGDETAYRRTGEQQERSFTFLRRNPMHASNRSNLPIAYAFAAAAIVVVAPAGGAMAASNFKVLYSFCSLADCDDGVEPFNSALVRDRSGNLYGAASAGGGFGHGTVFRVQTGVGETRQEHFPDGGGCQSASLSGMYMAMCTARHTRAEVIRMAKYTGGEGEREGFGCSLYSTAPTVHTH
jgi:uncharacterized repeat protein (TIGR03803 family)